MKTAVYFIFLLAIWNVENARQQTKTIFRFLKFEDCHLKKYKEKAVSVVNFTYKLVSVDKQISASTINLKNVPSRPQLHATALKCESIEYDSCLEMWSVNFDICSKLQEKFYSKITEIFKPTLKCPLKDGIYKSVNYTAPPDELLKFLKNAGFKSITDYYIGLRLVFYGEKKVRIGCIDSRGKFYDIKSKELQKTV